MKKWLLMAGTLISITGMAGCQSSMMNEEAFACPEDRSVFQMCTMDYSPVCGVRADDSEKTYSNSCGACGDPEIITYRVGECE